MSQAASLLEPEVEIVCTACGAGAAATVCNAGELATQREAARRLHRVRLRRRTRGVLEERASFTHDYVTRLLQCRRCGLLYRSPRPAADAVLEAYVHERYSEERLPQMFASQLELFR